MKAQGKVEEGENPLEEHHLIPKGITAAFMGRADELVAAGKASRQDVLAMAEYLQARNRYRRWRPYVRHPIYA